MIIDERAYSPEDQKAFAQLSGDYNPMHLNPISARREMFGSVVVHGMNATLAALDAYVRTISPDTAHSIEFSQISAKFTGPIYLGDSVVTTVNEGAGSLATLTNCVDTVRVLEIKVTRKLESSNPVHMVAIPNSPSTRPLEPRRRTIQDIEDSSGSLDLYLDENLARQLYPHLIAAWAPLRIASLLALTRLVGMECPGHRSIFQSFRTSFGTDVSTAQQAPTLDFHVSKVDDRFGLVNLDFEAAAMNGTLQAFVRPEPQVQPTLEAIRAVVQPSEFVGQCALVIGGSRGLGETSAKIIAAGGGSPIITYHSGLDDATRVSDEIRASGGTCEVLHCDARSATAALDHVLADGRCPTQFYYFATPKIGLHGHTGYSRASLDEYLDIYVDAFAVLCHEIRKRWRGPVSVFYPSTVFVDETASRMDEYAAAKAAGEVIARYISARDPSLRIVVKRLPRVATDQTLTLIGRPSADALQTMLPIIRSMSEGTNAE